MDPYKNMATDIQGIQGGHLAIIYNADDYNQQKLGIIKVTNDVIDKEVYNNANFKATDDYQDWKLVPIDSTHSIGFCSAGKSGEAGAGFFLFYHDADEMVCLSDTVQDAAGGMALTFQYADGVIHSNNLLKDSLVCVIGGVDATSDVGIVSCVLRTTDWKFTNMYSYDNLSTNESRVAISTNVHNGQDDILLLRNANTGGNYLGKVAVDTTTGVITTPVTWVDEIRPRPAGLQNIGLEAVRGTDSLYVATSSTDASGAVQLNTFTFDYATPAQTPVDTLQVTFKAGTFKWFAHMTYNSGQYYILSASGTYRTAAGGNMGKIYSIKID